MSLTDKSIKALKPTDKEQRILDEKGLYICVLPTGAKSWQHRYTVDGKARRASLGTYPEVSLAEARRRRDENRVKLAAGQDPLDIRAAEKRQALIAAENSFEAIAKEWWRLQYKKWKPDYAQKIMDSLTAEVFPVLGTRQLSTIEPLDVLAMIRHIEKRGSLDMASRTLQRCNAIFAYAVVLGKIRYNPAADLRGGLEQRKVTHYRHLTADQLPAFLAAIDTYSGRYVTRLAMKLLTLTFVRSYELRHAQWDQFDIERAEWRIPPRYMKMKRLHIVPLSRQALEVIEQIRALTGNRSYLFPNNHRPLEPISDNVFLKVIEQIGYKELMMVHGIRATASTILNENGFNADVIERQLAHVERNKVRAAYNHADYLPERRKMMQWWADYLDVQLRGKGEVVSLPVRQLAG